MQNYTLFRFTTPDPEILMAFLADLPFEAFEEEACLNAYVREDQLDEDFFSRLEAIRSQVPFSFDQVPISGTNWNAEWESRFQPVRIGKDWLIRASFHEQEPGFSHTLVIDPKMAFGTGHHETTSMMLSSMTRISFQHAKVLDFGCGTGILAIAASLLGAASVWAVDNDPNCVENCRENCEVNGVRNVVACLGDLAAVKDRGPFDVILANINRHVILSSLNDLRGLAKPAADLLISGCLLADEDVLVREIGSHGFSFIQKMVNQEWLCLHFQRS